MESSALRAITLTLLLALVAGTPVLAQDICPQCVAWGLCCNQFMQECVTCQGDRPSAPRLKHSSLASSSSFHEFLMLDRPAGSAGGTSNLYGAEWCSSTQRQAPSDALEGWMARGSR